MSFQFRSASSKPVSVPPSDWLPAFRKKLKILWEHFKDEPANFDEDEEDEGLFMRDQLNWWHYQRYFIDLFVQSVHSGLIWETSCCFLLNHWRTVVEKFCPKATRMKSKLSDNVTWQLSGHETNDPLIFTDPDVTVGQWQRKSSWAESSNHS